METWRKTEALSLSHQVVNNPDEYYFTLRPVGCGKGPIQTVIKHEKKTRRIQSYMYVLLWLTICKYT